MQMATYKVWTYANAMPEYTSKIFIRLNANIITFSEMDDLHSNINTYTIINKSLPTAKPIISIISFKETSDALAVYWPNNDKVKI